MPFVINPPRGGRRLGLLLAAVALLALPTAQASASSRAAARCAGQSFTQTFRPWNDRGSYTLAPGADIEGDLAGWTLTAGAMPVAENEPFHVGGPLDSHSLALPDGSSATTAPVCIGLNYPFFRVFARNSGSTNSALQVDVLYLNPAGHVLDSQSVGQLRGSSAWAPSRRVSLAIGQTGLGRTGGTMPVAFRFTPAGSGGNWQIDDLYVDPYARG
jgi:hypothetical protein